MTAGPRDADLEAKVVEARADVWDDLRDFFFDRGADCGDGEPDKVAKKIATRKVQALIAAVTAQAEARGYEKGYAWGRDAAACICPTTAMGAVGNNGTGNEYVLADQIGHACARAIRALGVPHA